jgi:signal transduction histidine kinase
VKVDIELLETKEETSLIRIRVQDTGPGMSEDELDVHPYPLHSNVGLHV